MATVAEGGFTDSTADELVTSDFIGTGAIHWVYSVSGSDSNSGTESEPLATLAQAITNATANNGDIILIKSGHTETRTTAITVSKAGVKIFGIGSGSSAPRFTANAAIDLFNVTANNVHLNNLYFPVGTTTGNSSRINIDAANVKVKGCTFLCGQYDQNTITITANGLYATIESCTMTVSVDGPDHGVIVESASAVGLEIKDCTFNAATYNWDVGAIQSSVAHLNYIYDTVTLTDGASISHSAASKGILSGTIADDGSQVQA